MLNLARELCEQLKPLKIVFLAYILKHPE